MKLLKINEKDNCAVALWGLPEGFSENGISAKENIPKGHKIAICDIKKGENIIKYGCPIGKATRDICKGEWLHTHNIKTNLEGVEEYKFSSDNLYAPDQKPIYFKGFKRSDGRVGIRNELLIIPTVGCVNKIVEKIFRKANELYKESGITISFYTHPYGCSQLGNYPVSTEKVRVNSFSDSQNCERKAHKKRGER